MQQRQPRAASDQVASDRGFDTSSSRPTRLGEEAVMLFKRKRRLSLLSDWQATILLASIVLSVGSLETATAKDQYVKIGVRTKIGSNCPLKIKAYIVPGEFVPTSQNSSFYWLDGARRADTPNSSIKHLLVDNSTVPKYFYLLDDPSFRDAFGEPLLVGVIGGVAMIHYATDPKHRIVYSLDDRCFFEDGLSIVKQADEAIRSVKR